MNEVHNYSINKERAIQQMIDMNKRAQNNRANAQDSYSRDTFLNFMQFSSDSDTIKILAIVLILMGDCKDMLLIFALVYILI